MSDSRDSAGSGLLFFLLGVAAGAVVVALTTPKTGPELRAGLKDMGLKVRDKARRLGQELRSEVEEGADGVSRV